MDSCKDGGFRSQWKQWLAALATTLPMITVGTLEITVQVYKHYLFLLHPNKESPDRLTECAILFTFCGCLIGAIFGAAIADMFGRKFALTIGTAICAVGGIIGLSSLSVASCVAMLLISGINAGIICTVVPLYISEIADNKIRGNLLMLQLLGIYIGPILVVSQIPVGETVVLPLNIPFIALPVAFCVAIFWFPESPYYLVSKKRYESAAKSLAFFRGISEFAGRQEVECFISSVDENCNNQGISQRICQLFRGQIWKPLVIIISLSILQWNGIYSHFRFDTVVALLGITTVSLSNSMLIMCVVYLIWSGILVLTINLIGRRYFLLGSTLGGLILTIFISVIIMDRSYISFFSNLFLDMFQIVIYGVCLVFVGELFPQNVKSIVSAMVIIFLTLIKCIIFGMNYLVEDFIAYETYILIPIFLLAFVFVLTFVPETKQKTFSEIQSALADNKFQFGIAKSQYNPVLRA